MLATKIEKAKREEGFTLIELLVVVIIIGILAAIAIPVFLSQRDKARESAVESTLRSAATYMEIYYTDENDYDTNIGELEGIGFRSGDKVEVANLPVGLDADGNLGPALADAPAYCLTAFHVDNDDIEREFRSTDGVPTEGDCT